MTSVSRYPWLLDTSQNWATATQTGSLLHPHSFNTGNIQEGLTHGPWHNANEHLVYRLSMVRIPTALLWDESLCIRGGSAGRKMGSMLAEKSHYQALLLSIPVMSAIFQTAIATCCITNHPKTRWLETILSFLLRCLFIGWRLADPGWAQLGLISGCRLELGLAPLIAYPSWISRIYVLCSFHGTEKHKREASFQASAYVTSVNFIGPSQSHSKQSQGQGSTPPTVRPWQGCVCRCIITEYWKTGGNDLVYHMSSPGHPAL